MRKIFSLLTAILFAGSMMASEAIMQYTGGVTTNMVGDGANNAATVGLDADLFTVLADKGGNQNLPGLNKANDIRLYADKNTGNGNIITVSIANGTINSIVLDIKQTATFVVKAGETAVTEEDGAYAINATSFSIQNTTSGATTQLQLNKITITYESGDPTPALENGFYLVGTMNEWTPAAEYHFTGNPENPAEFMLATTLAENDELKVVNVLDGNITAWFPNEGGNYVVNAAHAGEKTIYFRPDYQGGEDWFGACIYIAPNAEPQEEEFVGFDARTVNLGEQIAAGLAKNLVNVTFEETSAGKYSVNLVEGGTEGSFSFGGVIFAYTNSNAGSTAYKTYGTYIQPNGKDREIRIPLNAGEKANVILTEACAGVLVNGVSTDLVSGDNILTAVEGGLLLKTVATKPKIQAILPVAEEPAKFYITGDAATVGESLAWNPAAIKVTEDSYTFENLAAGDYKLKVTLDGTWGDGMVKGFSDLTTVADGLTADGDGNICFSLAEAGDVVVTYTAEAFTLAGNFYVEPQPQGCDWDNIDFLGDGSPEQTFGSQFKICMPEGMSVVNIQKPGFASESGIYVTFPSDAFGTISLPESAYETQGAGMILHCSAFTEEYTEVTVNCQGNDIVFTVYNAKGSTPEPVANYYVIGSMTDWEVSEDYILTPNNEAEGQEFMGEFTFAANDAFKVVKNNKEVWYPDGMGNDFVISEAGDYTVYFRPNADGGEGWHYGYIYAAKKEATAISNTAADAEAVKVLNNGMLLIRKGNKTYNVMGQAVK